MTPSGCSQWLLPFAACALVIGLFAWMAECARPYGLKSNPTENNYNLLVQGFQAGKLSMNLAVPPGLAQLADPYDPQANSVYRRAPYSLNDLSYHRGRLYLYSGVVPVVLLFWPWAALSGHYLSYQGAVALFCAAAFLAGAGVLLGLWRRYFPEVSAAVAAAGALAMGLAAGMPILLQQADFLEVPISCACALSFLALAGVCLAIEQPARRGRWLAAASLAYGFAVGARPSVLFGAVMLLVPVVLSWRERAGGGSPRRPLAMLAAAAPLALCGLALMLYNDLRFGSPFDFGWRYQLAPIRQDSVQPFSLGYFWFNFRVYFLEPAHWSGMFPFVRDIAGPPLPHGHAPFDGEEVFGVLANIPVLWLALAAPLAWRGRNEAARTGLRAIASSATLLFGASAIVLSLFFASTWRYESEFLPAPMFLSVIGIFGIERALAGRKGLQIAARAGWSLLLAFSVAFNLLQSVNRHAVQIEAFAQSRMDAGQVREAIALYEHSLRLEPEFAKAHNNLAVAFVRTGNLDEAIAHFEAALRLNPDDALLHYNLGMTLRAAGRSSEAAGQLSEAVRLRELQSPASH